MLTTLLKKGVISEQVFVAGLVPIGLTAVS